MASPHGSNDGGNAGSPIGNDKSGKQSQQKGDKKRKALLASLAGLALLSLLILLGNPGLLIPPNGDDEGREAEATDNNSGDDSQNNDNANATESSGIVTESPAPIDDSAGDIGDDGGSTLQKNNGSGGFVFIIPSNNGTGSGGGGGSGSGGHGGSGGGGGGGGGGSGSGGSGSSNHEPLASDGQIVTDEDTPVIFKMNGTDSDGDDLQYEIITAPTNGILVSFDDASGNATYSPLADYNGQDVMTFIVRDSRDSSNVAMIEFTINPVNDPPVVTPGAFTNITVTEDNPTVIDIISNVTDPEGGLVTICNVTQPSHGTVTINGNGTVTYTPDPDYNGPDSFDVTVCDSDGGSTTVTVTVIVTGVNDAPVASDMGDVTTDEDTPVDIILDVTDPDSGDTLSYTIVTLPMHGVLTDPSVNGTVTYTPESNYHGTDSFTFIASDGTLDSNNATVTITINSVNDAPTIVDGSLGNVQVEEDGSTEIDIISNVNDADGDTVTITDVSQPSHGTVTDNGDGTVTYTPDPDYNGPDSFDFTVEDGNGGTTIGTADVTVISVNDAPVSSNIVDAQVEEDSSSDILMQGQDIDGDSLTYSVVQPPAHGTVTNNGDGTVTYTPNSNYNGADSFTYQASDGSASSNIATVGITVNAVNDNPVANDDQYNIGEDDTVQLDVMADDSDLEGDTLTIEDVSGAEHGIVEIIGGGDQIQFTPGLDVVQPDSFEYTISDGNGGSATATVTITINAVNDAPDANDVNVELDEDSAVEVLMSATDSDAGDSLTYSITSQPLQGTLSGFAEDDGTVTYTPNANYNGADSFTFQASDGIEQSNIASIQITVNPVNDNPVASNDLFGTLEDVVLNGNVLANDVDIDGDTLGTTPMAGLLTAHGMVTIDSEGAFSYSPEANYYGADSFQYEMLDGNGGSALAMASITISAVNDAPSASDDLGLTTLEAPVLIHVLDNDSDIDSGSMNVASVGSASHGSVVISNNGQGVIYTPASGFTGLDSFTYSVSDGSLTDTATVTVEVYNAKFGHLMPPVGGGGDHEFEQGDTASVRFKLTDASGEDINDAIVILKIQELDEDNNPIGPVMNATSAGGSSDGNLIIYSTSFYHYNLKTDDMTVGTIWALYVYLIDDEYNPPREILMEDSPIDGISTTIRIK